MDNADHLARYPLADLFLDSSPYGAHTTAADSLWMNVPILTVPGHSFASRVCASLLAAAGVGELACASGEEYVEQAVAYGLDRDRLVALKAKMAEQRDTCPLFDTPSLVGHLENLYRQMWADFKRGALPVPDLRNLEVYHEIGAGLDLENSETLSREDYAAMYRHKMAEWNSFYRVMPDYRFWRAESAEPQAHPHLAVA